MVFSQMRKTARAKICKGAPARLDSKDAGFITVHLQISAMSEANLSLIVDLQQDIQLDPYLFRIRIFILKYGWQFNPSVEPVIDADFLDLFRERTHHLSVLLDIVNMQLLRGGQIRQAERVFHEIDRSDFAIERRAGQR